MEHFSIAHLKSRLLRRMGRNQDLLDRVVPMGMKISLVSQVPDISQKRALEISGDEYKSVGFASYTSLYYPQFDICTDVPDQKFDLILAEQVFEHLLWPYKAGRNVYAMLSDGGYFLVSTPFLLKVHDAPVDCTRWTETGLKYFLAECGFPIENMVSGSWGNRTVAKANIDADRQDFARYVPLLHSRLQNDPTYPVQVWVLAQKQTSEPLTHASS